MGTEIERKYLVEGDAWRALARGTRYRQGYLSRDRDRTVRIRSTGDKAHITIKGPTVGARRLEFEYEIPVGDGEAMLDALAERPLIEKNRYRIPHGAVTIEVDEFLGENAGLVVAEVELQREDQAFDKPAWLGREVTDDARYYNANLTAHPFSRW